MVLILIIHLFVLLSRNKYIYWFWWYRLKG